MPVEISCPRCTESLQISSTRCGKVEICPRCRARYRVPAWNTISKRAQTSRAAESESPKSIDDIPTPARSNRSNRSNRSKRSGVQRSRARQSHSEVPLVAIIVLVLLCVVGVGAFSLISQTPSSPKRTVSRQSREAGQSKNVQEKITKAIRDLRRQYTVGAAQVSTRVGLNETTKSVPNETPAAQTSPPEAKSVAPRSSPNVPYNPETLDTITQSTEELRASKRTC